MEITYLGEKYTCSRKDWDRAKVLIATKIIAATEKKKGLIPKQKPPFPDDLDRKIEELISNYQ